MAFLGIKLETTAVCGMMALLLIMDVPRRISTEQQCEKHLSGCYALIAPFVILRNLTLATACSSRRSRITRCVDSGKKLCNTSMEHKQLNWIQSYFDKACKEDNCIDQLSECQSKLNEALAAAVLPPEDGTDEPHPGQDVYNIHKICPVYQQERSCKVSYGERCQALSEMQTLSTLAEVYLDTMIFICKDDEHALVCKSHVFACLLMDADSSFDVGLEEHDSWERIRKCRNYQKMSACLEVLDDDCKEDSSAKTAYLLSILGSELSCIGAGRERPVVVPPCKTIWCRVLITLGCWIVVFSCVLAIKHVRRRLAAAGTAV